MGKVPAIEDYDSDSLEANYSDSDEEEEKSSSTKAGDDDMEDTSASSSSAAAAASKKNKKKKRANVKSAATHKSSASSKRREAESWLLQDEGDLKGLLHVEPKTGEEKALYKDYSEIMSWMHFKHIRECKDLRFFPHAHVVYHPDDADKPKHARRVHKLELGASVGDFCENGTHTSYELPYVHVRIPEGYKMNSDQPLTWDPELEEADVNQPHQLPAGALSCTWMDVVEGKSTFPIEFHWDLLKRLCQAGKLTLAAVQIYRRFMAYRCVAHVRCVQPWLDAVVAIKDIWDTPGMERMLEPIVLARPPLTNRDYLHLYKFYPWDSQAPWFYHMPPRCIAYVQPSVDLYGRDLHEAQQRQLALGHSVLADAMRSSSHAPQLASLTAQMRALASQQAVLQKQLDALLPSLQLPVTLPPVVYTTENQEHEWTSEQDKQLLADYATLFPQGTPPNWVLLATTESSRGISRKPSAVRTRFLQLQCHS